jgi:hypothetical protein
VFLYSGNYSGKTCSWTERRKSRGGENRCTAGDFEKFSEEGSQINLNPTEFVFSNQSENESVHEDTRENEHTLGVQNGKEEHKVTSECYEWEMQLEKLLDVKLKTIENEFSNFNPYNTKKAQDCVKTCSWTERRKKSR